MSESPSASLGDWTSEKPTKLRHPSTKYIRFPMVNPLISWILIDNFGLFYIKSLSPKFAKWMGLHFPQRLPTSPPPEQHPLYMLFPFQLGLDFNNGIKISGSTSYLVGIHFANPEETKEVRFQKTTSKELGVKNLRSLWGRNT